MVFPHPSRCIDGRVITISHLSLRLEKYFEVANGPWELSQENSVPSKRKQDEHQLPTTRIN